MVQNRTKSTIGQRYYGMKKIEIQLKSLILTDMQTDIQIGILDHALCILWWQTNSVGHEHITNMYLNDLMWTIITLIAIDHVLLFVSFTMFTAYWHCFYNCRYIMNTSWSVRGNTKCNWEDDIYLRVAKLEEKKSTDPQLVTCL